MAAGPGDFSLRLGAVAAATLLIGACGGDERRVAIHTEIAKEAFVVADFTADGPGFCTTGTVLPSRWQPADGSEGTLTYVRLQFECDDDSGIFAIDTDLPIPFAEADDPSTTTTVDAAWGLSSGFDDYRDVQGSGDVSVEITTDAFVWDGVIDID